LNFVFQIDIHCVNTVEVDLAHAVVKHNAHVFDGKPRVAVLVLVIVHREAMSKPISGCVVLPIEKLHSPAYVASKHGVIGLTQTAAWEYGAKGLRINAVGSSYIHTPMVENLEQNPEALEALISAHALGRLGRPEEVAELVAWLA
jgi:NAD(P)-dependent dehydrogenase (short-subunit alcohol dehydrogenase family)